MEQSLTMGESMFESLLGAPEVSLDIFKNIERVMRSYYPSLLPNSDGEVSSVVLCVWALCSGSTDEVVEVFGGEQNFRQMTSILETALTNYKSHLASGKPVARNLHRAIWEASEVL